MASFQVVNKRIILIKFRVALDSQMVSYSENVQILLRNRINYSIAGTATLNLEQTRSEGNIKDGEDHSELFYSSAAPAQEYTPSPLLLNDCEVRRILPRAAYPPSNKLEISGFEFFMKVPRSSALAPKAKGILWPVELLFLKRALRSCMYGADAGLPCVV